MANDPEVAAFLLWTKDKKLPQYSTDAWSIFLEGKLTAQQYNGFLKAAELYKQVYDK